jgi:hypothetical protein
MHQEKPVKSPSHVNILENKMRYVVKPDTSSTGSDEATEYHALTPTCRQPNKLTAYLTIAICKAHPAYIVGISASFAGIVSGAVSTYTLSEFSQKLLISLFKLGFMTPSIPGLFVGHGKERAKRALEVCVLITSGALPWVEECPPAVSGLLTLFVPALVASSFPGFTHSGTVMMAASVILGMIGSVLSLLAKTPSGINRGMNLAGAGISLAFGPLSFGDKPLGFRNFLTLPFESQINFSCMLISALFQLVLLSENAPIQLVNASLTLLAIGALFLNLSLAQLTQRLADEQSSDARVVPINEEDKNLGEIPEMLPTP